jgi:hypothetical protein
MANGREIRKPSTIRASLTTDTDISQNVNS